MVKLMSSSWLSKDRPWVTERAKGGMRMAMTGTMERNALPNDWSRLLTAVHTASTSAPPTSDRTMHRSAPTKPVCGFMMTPACMTMLPRIRPMQNIAGNVTSASDPRLTLSSAK